MPFKQWVWSSNLQRVTKSNPGNVWFPGIFFGFTNFFGRFFSGILDLLAICLQPLYLSLPPQYHLCLGAYTPQRSWSSPRAP